MGIMNKFIQEHMDVIDKEMRDLGTYLTTEELHELAVMELKRSGPIVEVEDRSNMTAREILDSIFAIDLNKIEEEE